jgi:hypothetical protein
MNNVTEIDCARCGGIIKLKNGAAYRRYCSDCKKSLRVNWAAKMSNDRRARTLKKREIETLN